MGRLLSLSGQNFLTTNTPPPASMAANVGSHAVVVLSAGGGDLVAADECPVEQIDVLAVLRTRHQGKIRIIVPGKDVRVTTSTGLKLQRQDLNVAIRTLPKLPLIHDTLRCIAFR